MSTSSTPAGTHGSHEHAVLGITDFNATLEVFKRVLACIMRMGHAPLIVCQYKDMGHGTKMRFQNLSGTPLVTPVNDHDPRTPPSTGKGGILSLFNICHIKPPGKTVLFNGSSHFTGHVSAFPTARASHHQGRPRRDFLFFEHVHISYRAIPAMQQQERVTRQPEDRGNNRMDHDGKQAPCLQQPPRKF